MFYSTFLDRVSDDSVLINWYDVAILLAAEEFLEDFLAEKYLE